ncbi:MAG: DUF2971 domain-containing protein [Gammaproteobacteria bacterium AqS3]|nr:DUF2971 domain-containing protein [Gammaproteobacteria bacterium AqS3]
MNSNALKEPMPDNVNENSRRVFYKYITAKVAIKTLKNETLRWSSPLCFNDPFDVPRTLAGDMKYSDISTAMACVIEKCIWNPQIEIGGFHNRAQEVINDGRGLKSQKDKEIYIKSHLARDPNTRPMKLRKKTEEVLKESRQSFLERIQKMRILCLSLERDIVSMWYHYAEKHRGVVLEFDNNISSISVGRNSKFHCVDYQENLPEIFTAKGWAEMMMSTAGYEKFTQYHLYVKKSDWEYEKECRIAFMEKEINAQKYTDVPFSKESILKIYFGPKTRPRHKKRLMKLILKRYPHVQAYDMKFEFGWKMTPVPVKDVKRRWLDLFKFNKHRKNCGS